MAESSSGAGTSSAQKWWVLLGIVVIVAALILVVRAGRSSQETAGGTFADPVKGNPDALVMIEEFSDFQCPACQQAAPILSDIVDQYGSQVRVVYNDYPLTRIHPHAYEAAVAGQCAQEQDLFWPWHDRVFAELPQWSRTEDPTEYFAQVFRESATTDQTYDEDAFRSCVEDADTEASVEEDLQEGENRNISGTPTLFVNGERVVLSGSYDVLYDMIDDAVREAYGDDAVIPGKEVITTTNDDADDTQDE